jgi:hypothetical protein
MKKLTFLCLLFLVGCSKDSSEEQSQDPASPLLSLPANNALCETGTSVSETHSDVAFTWESSANTESYDLTIENLDTSTIQNVLNLTEPNAMVKLEKATAYSWMVESKNSLTSKTNTSATWKFYLAGPGTSNHVPFPATLIKPESNVTISRNSNGIVDFLWEGADPDTNDELTYTLFVDNIDGKQTPNSAWSDLKDQSVSVALDGSTKYYWRVLTSDGSSSSFSQIQTFTTD